MYIEQLNSKYPQFLTYHILTEFRNILTIPEPNILEPITSESKCGTKCGYILSMEITENKHINLN